MTDRELADHAERLHGLAAARTGTRDDLIQLRDIMPRVIERFRAQLEITDDIVTLPKIRVERFPQLAVNLASTP
ncbi:hypothetical protein [Sphingobium sp.]|uniref:hypothetical protein n=1 Tax=Sphingobium sp. TaxID=1912891 RepID=UPI002B639CF7|nr:hypothetical protein [Sphingobium sp.]HUD90084.1 hypothetical protein [Sphingobium sp.]